MVVQDRERVQPIGCFYFWGDVAGGPGDWSLFFQPTVVMSTSSKCYYRIRFLAIYIAKAGRPRSD